MVFDFLKRTQTGPVPEKKASATGRVVAWGNSGRVAWSPRDAVSLARIGFQGNPIGFRAVKLISEAAAALPLILQDNERRYETHPVLDLIRRPNGAQGRAELFEAIYGFLLLSGNAYIEAVPGMDKLPGELHVLRSDRMALVPGSDGWPVGYDYSVGGRTHRFATSPEHQPICHIKTFHPSDDHYGFSPLQAAAVAIDVHTSASAWSKALLDNAARPSGDDCVQRCRWSGSVDQRAIRPADRRDGEPSSGRAQCGPPDAAGRWAGLEADGVQPVGYGIPEDQRGSGARYLHRVRGAADAGGHSG